MNNIEGETVRLRAVEPEDTDLLYRWENDCDVWLVSGTTAPFSREQMRRFIARQQDADIFCGQLRLMIETKAGARTVGAVDLFEFDPLNSRVGLGILIYESTDRGRGYAADAVRTLCRHLRERLHLHQVWCNVGTDNEASLRLFRSAGFSEAGVRRDWQRRADGYCDEILMQKILE